MKKFSTLILLLAAIVGLQANAAIYMVGGAKAIGKWDPTNGLELTELAPGSGMYAAQNVNIYNGGNDFYFIFTDVAGSWEDVNGSVDEETGEEIEPSHRFSPLDANEQVAAVTGEPIKVQTQYSHNGDASYFAPDGVYTIMFNANTLEFQFTRIGDAEDDSDPVVVTGKTTVYLKSSEPETAKIYAWGKADEGEPFGGWSGKLFSELPTIEVDGVTYYVAEAPAAEIGIVFNNGSGTQTSDIDPVSGIAAYEYPVDGDFTQYAEIPVPVEVSIDPIYVMGQVNGNGWAPNVGVEMTTTDGIIYTLKDAEVAGYFSFTKKLAEDASDWDGIAEFRFAAADASARDLGADAIGVPQALSEVGTGYDDAFSLPAGTYTLTLNMSAKTLTVTTEQEVVEPEYEGPTGELYIIGEVNGNGWSPAVGVKMDKVAEGKFEATVTASADNDGVSYFRFTEKLGTDWNKEFNLYNYACADGDPAITAERYGDAIAITDHGVTDPSFNIAYETEFKVTVDLNALTVVFEAAGDAALKGDVNGDGQINATDIAAVVDVIAGNKEASEFGGRADVNADGQVNATDIAAVVDIISGVAAE